MNELKIQPFAFDDNLVRTIKDENGKVWFVAKDICDVLSIGNVTDVVGRLDEDEKLTSIISTSGQNREMWIVTESGLYNLIFRSNKPEAKAFRKWVTSEVLPQLRATGTYSVKPAEKRNKVTRRFHAVNLYMNGLSIDQIAKEIGVSYATVSRWRLDDAEDSMRNWDALAEIASVPTSTIANIYLVAIKRCVSSFLENPEELKDARVADALTKHIAILNRIAPNSLRFGQLLEGNV